MFSTLRGIGVNVASLASSYQEVLDPTDSKFGIWTQMVMITHGVQHIATHYNYVMKIQ